MANLRHPNIVQVYDFDIQDDLIFMVMEYIDGVNVHTKLVEVGNRGERMPIKLIGWIINDIASALDYAHTKDMLHRDIKPSNIMIDTENKAYLTDFGIAKLLSDQKFTATGTLVGTPAYMSPEQSLGDDISKESDIYSLGVVAFEMLTGQVPYDAKTPIGIVHKQINDPIPNMSELVDGVPGSAQEVIDRALAKAPGSRFSSAEDLVGALRTALQALESTDPIAVPAEESPTVVDDVLEAPTVTMKAEEMEQPTVVMESETKKEDPPAKEPKKKAPKQKQAPKPEGEKKKIPVWATIAGGVALLAVVGVILTQVLDIDLGGMAGPGTENVEVTTVIDPISDDETEDSEPTNSEEMSGEDLFLQGEELIGQEKPEEALEYFNRAIDTGYETGYLYHLRAWAFQMMGHLEESRDSWSRAIELEPENFEYWMERGWRKFDLGDLPGAIEDIQHARELAPDVWVAQFSMGLIYYFSEEDQFKDESHEAFDQAIALEPNNPESRRWRAELKLQRFGDPASAIEDLNIAVEFSDPNDPGAIGLRGEAYLQLGEWGPCIDDLTRAIEIDPGSPWYFLKRGDCFVGLGDVDPARADYEMFLELAGDDPEFIEPINNTQSWLNEN